jgi:hypothetical protein
VEQAGDNRFRVTQISTGRTVLVTVAQPLASEGGLVWVAISVVPATGDSSPSGQGDRGLPSTR